MARGTEMKKWILIIDVERCEDCNNCFIACKDETVDNDWPGYSLSQPRHGHRWINIKQKERGTYPLIDVAYLPTTCMHCDEAPCISAAKDGAVFKRKDGVVIIDPEKSRNQKNIVKACPYGVIYWNEQAKIPQKCTFCAHLLDDGWKEPRCVQACPTGAMSVTYIDESDIDTMVASQGLETLRPQYKTMPRVYYKNLYRYTHCFVAGSVAFKKGGIEECAADAIVSLIKGSNIICQITTDCYGDFKFDNLEQNSGKYAIEVTFNGYPKKTLEIEIKQSLSLETIVI
jgi:Fe-S-cluster-containing dehydrogenase component